MPEKHKILLIEDNPAMLEANAMVLKSEGYAVVIAATLQQARKALQTADIQAVVLDVDLPDGSGFDFCREIRDPDSPLSTLNSGLSRIPVIFLTGRNQPEDRAEGLEAGADDYIVKPFLIEELTESIKALIKQKTPQSGELEELK